jgi:hypothetical protein
LFTLGEKSQQHTSGESAFDSE